MKETNIQQLVRLECAKQGLVVFRNNTGKLEDKTGRWVQFGLCEGSSDLIGYQLGTGRFVAIEVKTPNSRTGKDRLEKQQNFINHIISAGGIAGFAYSPDDVKKIVDMCKQ